MARLLSTTRNMWAWTRFSNPNLIYMNYTKRGRVRCSQHQATNHHSNDEIKIGVAKVKDMRWQMRLQWNVSDPLLLYYLRTNIYLTHHLVSHSGQKHISMKREQSIRYTCCYFPSILLQCEFCTLLPKVRNCITMFNNLDRFLFCEYKILHTQIYASEQAKNSDTSPCAMSSAVYLYIVFPFISFKLATRHIIFLPPWSGSMRDCE